MATNTEKLNLKKPAQEDFYNVDDFNENFQKIDDFAGRKDNPHGVTKSQLGLGNVDNTSDMNKPVSSEQAAAIADAKKAGTTAQTDLNTHTSNENNPHKVTAEQVGALPITGGTLTGDLYFKSAGDVSSFLFGSGGAVSLGSQMGEHRSQLHVNSPDANLSYGILFVKDGNNYSLFGEHNKELMSLYFLPLSGGKVTGNITAPSLVLTDYAAPMEIGQYIDMHIKNSPADFDGRIHLGEDGTLLFSKTPGTNYQIMHNGNYFNFENKHIVTGTYTGTIDTSIVDFTPGSQFIELGFTPKAVFVFPKNRLSPIEGTGNTYLMGFSVKGSDCHVKFQPEKPIVAIKTNGFEVYAEKSLYGIVNTNQKDYSFNYIAFK